MNILFYSDHFYPEMSAPAAHVYERSKIWVKNGHNVTVVTNIPNMPFGKPYEGYKNKIRQVDYIDGIKVIRVGTYMAENKGTIKRILDYTSYMISALFNSILIEKPDVVISTSPHLFTPMAGVIFSIIRRVPHVFEIRDLWPHSIAATTSMSRKSTIYKVLEFLELKMYKKSKRIIAMTNKFKADIIQRGVKAEKVDVIINGANTELFTPRQKNKILIKQLNIEDKFIIGYLGTHGLPHNLMNVLNTAKLCKNPRVHFLFVGDGATKKELVEHAKIHKLTNVTFIGRQDKENMPEYWSICDAGLIHLKNDPLFKTVIPSKIFETMAMGLPIIYVGPKSEGSDIVEKHNVGKLIEPDNPEKFADFLDDFAEDKNKQKLYKNNSTTNAPLYTREAHAANTLNTLKHSLS